MSTTRNLEESAALWLAEIDACTDPSARLAKASRIADYLFGAAMCAADPQTFGLAQSLRQRALAKVGLDDPTQTLLAA